jgi:hypothetical protein
VVLQANGKPDATTEVETACAASDFSQQLLEFQQFALVFQFVWGTTRNSFDFDERAG